MSEQSIKEKSLEIRQETEEFANTRGRVANVLDDINETKANKTDVAQSLTDLSNSVNTSLGDKVDKTTASITEPDARFKYAYIFDENNNPRRMLAGDLGKNVANAALTSVSGAGLTLGANWDINTTGYYFSINGLSDVSNDNTFNTLLVQDSTGIVSRSNGKQPFLALPSLLTENERNTWKTLMNGGWTTNTMSVASINPRVFESRDEPVYIVLSGANLNFPPTSFKVEIMDEAGANSLATVPNSQVQLNTVGTSLVFWYNFKSLGLGKFKIRLWNGVADLTTDLTFTTVDNVQNIDLSTITWDFVKSTSYDAENNSTGGTFEVKTVATGEDTADIIGSLKSSNIFQANDNFVLEMQITMDQAQNNSGNNSQSYVGLGYSTSANALVKSSIVDIGFARNNNASCKIFNNSQQLRIGSLPQTATVTFMKQDNLISTILDAGTFVTISNNSISSASAFSIYIQLSRRIGWQTINGLILKAYKF